MRAGSDAAFEAAYDRHHRGILAFCRHMLGSREEAEDAVQHTFLAAYRQLRATDKPIQLRPWLYAIARNRCFSVLRARRPVSTLDDAMPGTAGLAAEVEHRADLRHALRDLTALPEDQRAALVLAELGDLDHAEIAEVLNVRPQKVKALVFQARSSLIASREARETPCVEIREQLAQLSGGSLRRNVVRRHLAECAGCREYREEVGRQRKALAALLPVVPSAGLKETVLGSIAGGIGPGGGAAAGAGAAAAASGAASSVSGLGGLSLLAKGGAAKLAATLAIGGAVAGGVAGVRTGHDDARPGPGDVQAVAATPRPAGVGGALGATPLSATAPGGPAATAPSPQNAAARSGDEDRSHAARGSGKASRRDARTRRRAHRRHHRAAAGAQAGTVAPGNSGNVPASGTGSARSQRGGPSGGRSANGHGAGGIVGTGARPTGRSGASPRTGRPKDAGLRRAASPAAARKAGAVSRADPRRRAKSGRRAAAGSRAAAKAGGRQSAARPASTTRAKADAAGRPDAG
ncbi:MAG TPA: sigma-70 family RNA polymerase sigma factor [Solirubrobacteraceae bacterium]|nr:sigma-70 family RNA polymerase sigma factor [Solirubrobacteraceae bacterium]